MAGRGLMNLCILLTAESANSWRRYLSVDGRTPVFNSTTTTPSQNAFDSLKIFTENITITDLNIYVSRLCLPQEVGGAHTNTAWVFTRAVPPHVPHWKWVPASNVFLQVDLSLGDLKLTSCNSPPLASEKVLFEWRNRELRLDDALSSMIVSVTPEIIRGKWTAQCLDIGILWKIKCQASLWC